jgi:hypothetical protein
MPRAGVSASRFDDGWDWIDPERDRDPAGGGERNDGPAYYDWSQTGDFRARPRTRALRAVPDPEPRRPARAGRVQPAERPARAARLERAERPAQSARLERAVRAAAPVAPLEPVAAAPWSPVVPVRRTVTITGRGAEGHLYTSSHRPAVRSYERAGFKPDRIAMWAVLLGVLMILAAATSAHAALLH